MSLLQAYLSDLREFVATCCQGWRRIGAGLAPDWRRGAGLALAGRRIGAGLAQDWRRGAGLAQDWRRIGAGLAQDWRRGAGLAQDWRRVGAVHAKVTPLPR